MHELAETVLRTQLDLAIAERDQARRDAKRLEANPPRWRHCQLCGALSKRPLCYAHRWAEQMPTFARGFWIRRTTASHRPGQAEARQPVQTVTTTTVTWLVTAADSITLRGIPAIGRGVAGAMHGTAPDTCARGGE